MSAGLAIADWEFVGNRYDMGILAAPDLIMLLINSGNMQPFDGAHFMGIPAKIFAVWLEMLWGTVTGFCFVA